MKWFKVVFYTLLTFTFIITLIFFVFNDSYKYSIQARVKYFMGDYKKAIELAQEAFELDPYNKMSFSILTQSKIALKFLDYIKDGKKYLQTIEKISQKDYITHEDRVRVKMICEVMIERYKKLSPTVLTPKKLVQESKNLYKKFKKIYEDIKD